MEKIYVLYTNFNWFVAVLVLISYVVIDGLYAKYTLEVVSLKPFVSATIGSFMHILLVFGVLSYTENWLYIFPLIIGSWIGTYFVVKSEKNKAVQHLDVLK